MQLTARFEEALIYATRLHAAQQRKGSDVPYVSHLLSVCGLVLEYGGSENEAIAALLHDAIEDQGGAKTREEIRDRFGDEVAAIVDGCTDTDKDPKPPWQQRKEEYLAHILEAPPSVLLVSAADKLHNVRSILADHRQQGETIFEIFKGKKEGTIWYYGALVEAYERAHKDGGVPLLVTELKRCVEELEELNN